MAGYLLSQLCGCVARSSSGFIYNCCNEFYLKSETQINSYNLFAVWTLGFNFSRCWGYFVKNSFFTIRAINGYTDFIICQFSTSISAIRTFVRCEISILLYKIYVNRFFIKIIYTVRKNG